MKVKKKILIAFCLIALIFLASLCGAVLYYYYHPSAVKPLLEETVSRFTGTSFTIKTLSYSLKPLKFRAKGITFKPLENQQGPRLEIPNLEADIALEGPFGRKTLTFKSLKIDGFSFQISEKVTLPKIAPKEKRPSFFGQILKGAVALLLFRDITFQAAEAFDGHIAATFGDKTLQASGIHAELNSEHRIAVSGSVQMKWLSQNALFIVPDVNVTTDHAISLVDPEIGAKLTARKATYQSPNLSVESMEAKAKLTYSHKQKVFSFEPADLHLEGISLKQEPEMELPALNLQLKTNGVFSIQERKLKATRLDLNLHDTLQLKGKLDMGLGDKTDFRLQVQDSHFLAERLLTLLPDRLKSELAPISLSGPIVLRGDVTGLRDQQKWSLRSDLQALLRKNQLSYRTEQIELNGRLGGTIEAKGRFPDIKISARLEGDDIILSGVEIQPQPFKVGLSLSGIHPVYPIKNLTIHIPRAKLRLGRRDILIDHIQVLTRKGKINAMERSLFLPEVRLESSLLKNLLISVEVGRERLIVELQGKDVHLIESAFALQLLPSGWEVNGQDSLQVSAVLHRTGDWTFASKLGLQDLDFQNPDSSYMGERISLQLETDGKLNLTGPRISADTTLRVDGGEVLYDRFYLDLNSNPFFSSIKGKYDLSKRSLKLSSLGLGLKDILTLSMNGTLHHKAPEPRIHLAVNLQKTSLKPIFHHFVLEPFKTEKPSLAALEVGGTVSADLKLIGTASDDWIVKGHCGWQGGQLSLKDRGFSFKGIDLDLPIWHLSSVTSDKSRVTSIERNQSRVTRDSSLIGQLSIQSLVLPPLPEQSVIFSLDASPNGLSVRSPTILRVPGGKVQLGPVVLRNMFMTRPSIETSLNLYSIELGPLLSGIWSRPIMGTIEGKLDPIRFRENTLSTHGEVRAEVFGGKILISGLGASGIFTSNPLYKLDAQWDDLNLAGLTMGTSFGKIEGILRGYMKDLEIAYGQPQKFDLLLETTKKRGTPQRISVKAVDNIALIGGGQSPFIGFAGGFASLFREFPYEKIGIRASLENDIFRINGTIKEGGKEYLVKRRGFSGVNVINQNPDSRISFKDMVKRIARVTASESGPVVK